jgi:hypothetical protein
LWKRSNTSEPGYMESNDRDERVGRRNVPWGAIVAGLVLIALALIGYFTFRGTKEWPHYADVSFQPAIRPIDRR